MKKLIAISLVLAFTSAAGFALADGSGEACGGKKCAMGKHSKRHGKHQKQVSGTRDQVQDKADSK